MNAGLRRTAAAVIGLLGFLSVAITADGTENAAPAIAAALRKPVRVAAIVTVYRHNTHADVIVSRILEGYRLNGRGPRPSLKLVSLYVDQTSPGDMSRRMAAKHKFLLAGSVQKALTLGTGKLSVDGVLLIAEHGKYGLSKTGQRLYPKRRLFAEIVKVFQRSGRVVPVFSDKHLSDNWTDAAWIDRTARRMKIPMMAGSSVPSYRREPPLDVKRHAVVEEIVAVSYGGVESYGFHALEMMQSLVERRKGGETGVLSVQCLSGDAVWKARKEKVFSDDLLQAALKVSKKRRRAERPLTESVKSPTVFVIRYRDGLRASVLVLNGTATEFSAAWRVRGDKRIRATLFALQDARPFMHFTYLLQGIEKMMHSRKPTWPVERTLLTTGILHAAMLSKTKNGKRIDTRNLNIAYRSGWNWTQPPVFRPIEKD